MLRLRLDYLNRLRVLTLVAVMSVSGAVFAQEEVKLSGQEKFDVASKKVTTGLYQVAYSPASNALFITSAVGRQVTKTELVKVDPETLEILARVTPPEITDNERGGLHAVYGVGVDDANGNVWVTNTRSGSVGVYKQSDLSLVKQYPSGTVGHGRDAVIDAKSGKVFVSSTQPFLAVFDAKTLEQLPSIDLKTNKVQEPPAESPRENARPAEGQGEQRGPRGGQGGARPQRGGGRPSGFTPMSLYLDRESGKLYTVSLGTAEAAIVDTASGKVDKIFDLGNAERASGVAYDSANKRLLVASQGSGNLLIVDPAEGKVLHDIEVGTGALNVTYEPVSKLSFVSVRGNGTIVVVNAANGEVVAVLDGGTNPNHLTADGKGNVFAVNKSRGEDDPNGDIIRRITLKAK